MKLTLAVYAQIGPEKCHITLLNRVGCLNLVFVHTLSIFTVVERIIKCKIKNKKFYNLFFSNRNSMTCLCAQEEKNMISLNSTSSHVCLDRLLPETLNWLTKKSGFSFFAFPETNFDFRFIRNFIQSRSLVLRESLLK